MFISVFLVAILSLSFLYYVYRHKIVYTHQLPPGPRGLPVVGNILQLVGKNRYHKLNEWAKQYGKVYTVYIGTKPVLVVNDLRLMREILSTFSSTGKFQTDSLLRISGGPFGVLNANGGSWEEQRRICMKTLKKFGFGNKRMETLILSEADDVCKWITKSNSENNNDPLIMQNVLNQAVINTLWIMVSSTRITLGDSNMAHLLKTFMEAFQVTIKTGLQILPWLKYVAPELSGYNAFDKECTKIQNIIEKDFEEHENTIVRGAPRDMIDAYIEYSEGDELKRKHAVGTVVELFVAGSESTSSTITWLLHYVSQNSQIQNKLHEEIDSILEGDPTLDHKSRMPFTESLILETLRFSSILPIGNIRQLLSDVEVAGLKLPKDLMIITNAYYVHFDLEIWENPQVFRPERFLSKEGIKLKEHLVAFQVGKRQCLGEPLAMDILFIFVTRLFQKFRVQPDPNIRMEEYYEPDVGGALLPQMLGLFVEPRK